MTMNLENIVRRLANLKNESKALWGSFSAQQMIEHLILGIKMSMGQIHFPMEVTTEKAEELKAFLYSDKGFSKNIPVGFVDITTPYIYENLDLAVDAFCEMILAFEEIQNNLDQGINFKSTHPYFGSLNYHEWTLLHQKHIEHHFAQFGL